jgi:hypothetical protein
MNAGHHRPAAAIGRPESRGCHHPGRSNPPCRRCKYGLPGAAPVSPSRLPAMMEVAEPPSSASRTGWSRTGHRTPAGQTRKTGTTSVRPRGRRYPMTRRRPPWRRRNDRWSSGTGRSGRRSPGAAPAYPVTDGTTEAAAVQAFSPRHVASGPAGVRRWRLRRPLPPGAQAWARGRPGSSGRSPGRGPSGRRRRGWTGRLPRAADW